MIYALGAFRTVASERGRQPTGLEEAWDWLDGLAVWLAGAMLLAGVIALVLERIGASWSLSLSGLPLAAIAWVVSPDYGVVLAAIVVASSGIGFYWSREGGTGGQPRAGADRAGLLAVVRRAFSRRRARDDRIRGNRLALGQTRAGSVLTVPFGSTAGVRGFLPGAPGSGKTVTLSAHALAYIAADYGVLVIDPKGDRSLRRGLAGAASSKGRSFSEWSPEGPCVYNPLARGTALEVADKALAGEQWTEPHYLRQAQRYLNLELEAMAAAGLWPANLRSLVDYLDPDRLDSLADRLDDEIGERVRGYLDGLSSRARQDLEGARNRLAVLAESRLGSLLTPGDGRVEIELRSALENGEVIYFQLDADRFPLASQMLGAAIVSDLVALTGELQGRPLRALVIIDEFSAVAAEEVSRLLSRSRSAGLSVLIGTQAFADFSLARLGDGTDSLRRQVLSHVDYVVAHRQSEPEAAELLGQMAGTRPAWSIARQVRRTPWGFESTADATRRRTREFICHPDEFKRLGVGEAIVIEPASRREATRVVVWTPTASVTKEAGDPGDAHRKESSLDPRASREPVGGSWA